MTRPEAMNLISATENLGRLIRYGYGVDDIRVMCGISYPSQVATLRVMAKNLPFFAPYLKIAEGRAEASAR